MADSISGPRRTTRPEKWLCRTFYVSALISIYRRKWALSLTPSSLRRQMDSQCATPTSGRGSGFLRFKGRIWSHSSFMNSATPLRPWAAKSGASVKMVQAQLGHKDPALTLRLYQHLFDDDLDALGDRMSAAFSESVDPVADAGDDKNARPSRGLILVEGGVSKRRSATTRDFMAPPGGFEPPTHGLGNRRSIL